MRPDRKSMKLLRRFMQWRSRIITSIESMERNDTCHFNDEKAMAYAVWAIVGLLFFAAIWFTCLLWIY